MGKNKTKAQKQKNVFQVANKHIKPKNKAKPVATSLKKINAGNSRKVETINKIFTEVQNEVKSVGKQKSPERTRKLQIPVSAPVESVNMEAATQLFSQL
ncbi:ribosomal biogenesis factor [Polypterus senegalus]|nr:ribosomal biogenesis factor [Polypterus senegalus]